ncbi:hypothetical protein Tco_0938781 [Tanacetum coccineum]|uniref:Uncharacterized protein n=1 Tax=Tanacetum coccineum TaxID=301880 RepID=A0ABQ5DI70_9ASTR
MQRIYGGLAINMETSLTLSFRIEDLNQVVLANEGFETIKIKYMGEYWVMLVFQSEELKNKFRENEALGWIPDFVEDEEDEIDSDSGIGKDDIEADNDENLNYEDIGKK